MKNLLACLLLVVALVASAPASHAQLWELAGTDIHFLSGAPSYIYEVNPGSNATIALAISCTYTAKNLQNIVRTGYINRYPSVYLNTAPPANQLVFGSAGVKSSVLVFNPLETKTIGPDVTVRWIMVLRQV